jgi:PKD repeat protein
VEATFTFTPSTGTPKSTTTPVSVVRTGQIGVEVERAAMDVCPGGAGGANSLTITPLDGYSGMPTVTFPTLPEGLTITPATIPVPAMPPARTVFFDVTAAPGTPSGPATVTALVSDPRGITSTVTFTANVLPPAFTAAAAPAAVTLNAGGSAGTVTASLVAGECAPTSDITVTPSGLPPGVTVTPASDAIVPPGFGPVAFSFQASSSAVPGSSTIVFTFRTSEGTARTATAVITVCGPPAAPLSPVVTPQGNPQGPVTATDFLALSWGAPASGFAPTRYEWRINGGSWNSVAGTSASAPPRGAIDPVQLFVRGFACDPEKGPGAEAASPVYSLAAPVASFAVPASIVAGQAVTFTDTSSPQATSWLWFPGDGIPATTVQSPTVTFSTTGPKVIVLVASNGSGSSSKATTINVLPASAVRVATGYAVRALEREPDGRLALGRVEVEPGTTLLLRRLEGEGEAVAFLRFVEVDGSVVLERRIVLAAGEEARHDLSAWGATGAFRVELVGPDGLEAAVEELSIPFGAPEMPVTPRRPRNVVIR